MPEVGVPEVARMLGVSPVRVRQLVEAGGLRARKVSGSWLIDVASVPNAPRRGGRPMSPRMAWGLVEAVEGRRAPWLSPKDVLRLKHVRVRLRADPGPELFIKAALVERAVRYELSCSEPEGLRSDPRVVLSGVSDPRSRMSAADQVEAYVHVDHHRELLSEHLLVESSGRRANVILHVSEVRPSDPVPLLLLAADLADHDRPRELGRARELIAQAVP